MAFSFGTTPATSAPLFGGFGASTTTTTQPASFSFGAPTITTTPAATLSVPAPSLFGAGPSASTQPAGFGLATNTSTLTTPMTQPTVNKQARYVDLPPDVKNMFDQIEHHIQSEIHIAETIKQRKSVDQLAKLQKEREDLTRRLDSMRNILERDAKIVEELKQKTGEESMTTEALVRTLDRFRDTQTTSTAYGLLQSNVPTTSPMDITPQFFDKVVARFEERIQQYRQAIDDIERTLQSLLRSNRVDPDALLSITKSQNDAFMALASRVAQLHDVIKAELERFRLHARMVGGFADLSLESEGPKVPLADIARARFSNPVQNQPQPVVQQAPTTSFMFTGGGTKRR